MHLPSKIWSCLTYLANILTLSSIEQNASQEPLGGHLTLATGAHSHLVTANDKFPNFSPPGGRKKYEGSDFRCEYPDMPDYEFCGDDPEDRGCWLRPKDKSRTDLRTFNIYTDYEVHKPKGVTREYNFTITGGTINADGLNFTEAKLINEQYPGPWLQACWGDQIIVNVTNQLPFNGTAMHWHGIRQLDRMHMDGVPGITQCPIAPNDYFVYNFSAQQYGSAWYHSHYSVQYADGMLGPLTIHGPHSGSFDEPKLPLLMTDWFHNSAYQVIHGKTPGYPTILLNGTGDIRKYKYETLEKYRDSKRVEPNAPVPPQYRLHFNQTMIPAKGTDTMRRKRYMLRLINTSFTTTFIFSIDHHKLIVISADFVAIENYTTTHLHIGIGQRYNVIVEAQPVAYFNKTDQYGRNDTGHERQHFWIRTTASPCFSGNTKLASLQGYDESGVLTYLDPEYDDPLTPIVPVTTRWPEIPEKPECRDEDVKDLVPIHKWQVGPPANVMRWFNNGDKEDDGKQVGERFDVVGRFMFGKNKPGFMKDFPVSLFSLERESLNNESFNPMQIDYYDPIFLRLNDSQETANAWPEKWSVVNEDHKPGSWIYMAIAGRHIPVNASVPGTGGAHPMHLHGHDFAILQQETDKELKYENIKLNKRNPARRDVVLLPESGFVVIAFKIDNPGSWIMHCHIAFHASEGLALQVMENRKLANDLWPPGDKDIIKAQRVCDNWKTFQNDCKKHYPGYDKNYKCYPACNNKKPELACPNIFQDDSGV